ncbi:DNA translocase FtsK [Alkalihalobacterium sp. APHAB7]|uniref:DNA translocase FtsK n=1 Tax=Alkalihalobacterium sp. APHAB7 TaxID=3402081 RepID=UPI003AB0A09E
MEPNKRKPQYGRLEADDRSSEMRVVHQYPKQGKFRFPVIDDESRTVTQENDKFNNKKITERKVEKKGSDQPQEKTRVVSTYQGLSEEYKSSSENKRELFSNSNFKPTYIPSPIYGFKKREEKRVSPDIENADLGQVSNQEVLPKSSEINDELSSKEDHYPNKEHEIAATTEEAIDVQDVILLKNISNFKPSLEQLDFEYNNQSLREQEVDHSSANSIKEDNKDLIEEEVAVAEQRNELQYEQEFEKKGIEFPHEHEVEEVKSDHLHQQEIELASNEFTIERELEARSSDSHEHIAHSTSLDHLDDQFDDLEVMEENTEYPNEQLKEENIELIRQEKSEARKEFNPSVNEVKEKSKERETKQSEQSQKRILLNSHKEETTQPAAKTIPFNVLMLPQDRIEKERKTSFEENVVEKESYRFPPIQMLNIPPRQEEESTDWLNEQGEILESTLQNFNVSAKVIHVTKGPSVTRFEIQPAPGVKVSKITSLTDDIKLCLAAKDIRMEAPIPGKHAIGIEVPNLKSDPVFLREILRRGEFQRGSALTVALGLDISGHPIVTNLAKMPHGLVAGATGSGKSVCINSILVSLLYKATPDQVKLLLVDPKMVELAPYNELPHLVTPVITDAKQATAALKWVVAEMERRYELFSQRGVRDIGRYNDLYSEDPAKPALPYIVVVIDELADLMMVSPQDVEEAICRIAQKARACGIHLLLATQRPSVDVITGLIKANIPTRIAFSVSSQVDSRTIIDMNGAERLLGKGDMLFHENGTAKPVRVQGTFVSDEEIERVIEFVKKQRQPQYLIENELLNKVQEVEGQEDDLFEEACYFVIEQDGASASSLQRRFRVGYNRAARLIDMMEAKGIVSEAMGSKPRNILITVSEFEENILATSTE